MRICHLAALSGWCTAALMTGIIVKLVRPGSRGSMNSGSTRASKRERCSTGSGSAAHGTSPDMERGSAGAEQYSTLIPGPVPPSVPARSVAEDTLAWAAQLSSAGEALTHAGHEDQAVYLFVCAGELMEKAEQIAAG